MNNASVTPAEARPADARRQHRIDLANAHTQKLNRQRVDWYRGRGFPPEKIARIVGVPIETVIDQTSG